VSGEGSLFDVPPAAFGRYRVLHQIGAGSTGPVFRGEDPESGTAVAIKALRVNLPPERAHEVADGLTGLVTRAPRHGSLAAPLAAGLASLQPYLVTVLIPGQSLDVAWRDFGPAAIGDLLPRLQAMADALDLGVERALVHGALHPRDVVVSADDTVIVGLGVSPILAHAGVRPPTRRPYTAPEVAEGQTANAASDQFSLAAMAFEWMTGRRVAGPAGEGPLDFPAMPGIDGARMAAALTTGLARKPSDRHRSVRDFVEAVAAAVLDQHAARPVAEPRRRPARAAAQRLPIEDDDEPTESPGMLMDESVEAVPPDPPRFATLTDDESPSSEPRRGLRLLTPLAPDTPEVRLDARESVAWQGTSLSQPSARLFGPGALVAAAGLGAIVGFGVAFATLDRAPDVAGPSADVKAIDSAEPPAGVAPIDSAGRKAGVAQGGPIDSAGRPAGVAQGAQAKAPAPPPSLPSAMSASGAAAPASGGTVAELTPPPKSAAASKPPPARSAAAPSRAAEKATPSPATGSLLIRSVPSGSAVTVDGVKRGATPLTVRALALGTRQILVERAGYAPAERSVTLTGGRPSRSVDVRLTALAPGPSRGVPGARSAEAEASAVTMGSLVVESKPPGAQVTISGVVRGTTPLTIGSLSPGTYQVTLQLAGYQLFTTQVTVKAGASVRAAGSLVLRQEQE
jgi:hypothetical protein